MIGRHTERLLSQALSIRAGDPYLNGSRRLVSLSLIRSHRRMILSLAKLRVLIDVANTAKSAWDVVSRQATRIKALEARVAALEAALEVAHGKSPGAPCPFCGERGWRLKEQPHSDRDARHEIWACQSCGREQDKWVPTGIAGLPR